MGKCNGNDVQVKFNTNRVVLKTLLLWLVFKNQLSSLCISSFTKNQIDTGSKFAQFQKLKNSTRSKDDAVRCISKFFFFYSLTNRLVIFSDCWKQVAFVAGKFCHQTSSSTTWSTSGILSVLRLLHTYMLVQILIIFDFTWITVQSLIRALSKYNERFHLTC